MLEYLCFSGGGVRAVAYAKIPLALQELGHLDHIKGVIGTSAGAIIATLIACRIPPDEIFYLIRNMEFATFKDGSRWKVVDLIDIYRKFGYNPGVTFTVWLQDILRDYVQDADITLQGLFDKTGIQLVVVTTCLETKEALYLSIDSFPSLPVYKAVRMSMSIPVFFEPVTDVLDGKVYTYVDGGVTNNYALSYFKTNVLGFKLLASNEEVTDVVLPAYEPITHLISFLESVLQTMMYTIENTEIGQEYWQDSILLRTGSLKSMDFNPDMTEVDKVIESGYEAVYAYFKSLSYL